MSTTISTAGVVGTKNEIVLPERGWATNYFLHGIAWNGSAMLLIWTTSEYDSPFPCGECQTYAVWSAELEESGALIGGSERVLVEDARSAIVASNGVDFLIAYQRQENSTVEAVRVTDEHIGGALLIARHAIPRSIAASERDFVVTHYGTQSGVSSVSTIDPDGTVSTRIVPARQTAFDFGEAMTVNGAGRILIAIPQFVTSEDDPQKTWRLIGYNNEDLIPARRMRAVRR